MPAPNDSPFSKIPSGMVFLHARWSGPSAMALDRLSLALDNAQIPHGALLVIDLDENPTVYNVPKLAGRIHGWGEAFIVRDGIISGFRALGRDMRMLDEEIRRLIDENRGGPGTPAETGSSEV